MKSAPSADVFGWTSSWASAKGLKLWASNETGSTNTIAKDDEDVLTKPVLAGSESVSRPTLYLARRQVQGRGRGDHVWTAPVGSSLFSSWSFAIGRVPQPIFSALVGLALYEAVSEAFPGVSFNVKAPNDLFVDDRKTAGILIETVDQGRYKRTVVGVGLNVTHAPEELGTATCLARHVPDLDEASWKAFLEIWLTRLSEAVRAGLHDRLEPQVADRLKEALNRHPLLKEPILRVDEKGQLHSASRIVHWHEL